MERLSPDCLVAHRGYQRCYPENTLLSVTKAVEAGARFIEIDVLFSADGEPVLCHDNDMRRISGRRSKVHRLNWAELLHHPVHEPHRFGDRFIQETLTPLAALVPLLAANPQVSLFVEAKPAGIRRQGVKAVYRKITAALAPVLHQCILISYNHLFMRHAARQGFPRLGGVLRGWGDLNTEFMVSLNPEFIFCDADDIPLNADLHGRVNSKLVVYEVSTPETALAWLQRGADMVETFDIGGLLAGKSNHPE